MTAGTANIASEVATTVSDPDNKVDSIAQGTGFSFQFNFGGASS